MEHSDRYNAGCGVGSRKSVAGESEGPIDEKEERYRGEWEWGKGMGWEKSEMEMEVRSTVRMRRVGLWAGYVEGASGMWCVEGV